MRRMYSKPQLLEAVEQESKINGIKVFENIVDKDGHKRFIEGEGVKPESQVGITLTYNKWSLSGTHLMCVIGMNVLNGTSLDNNIYFRVPLPQWILDKIYPVVNTTISAVNYSFLASNFSGQSSSGWLKKDTDCLTFSMSAITLTADRNCRVQLDLLIDNE